MKTIKISDTKIKVMLSKSDMLSIHLGEGTLDTSSPEARDALRGFLAEAGRAHGVDVSSGRLFIQLYPAADGGCEMFVTRLDGKTDVTRAEIEDKEDNAMNLRGAGRTDTAERNVRPSRYSVGIYEFAELTPLLSVCDRLAHTDVIGQSAVYAETEPSRYFLVLCESGAPSALPDATDAVVNEYGGKRRKSGTYAYIKEHCSVVCGTDAVKCLGVLA